MADLRSTVTGASQLAGCTASQTLTFTAATDNLACTNISLTSSQFSGTLPVAQGGTGTSTAPTQYGVIYAATPSSLASTAAGTTGYPLIANSSAAPTFQQLNLSSAATGLLPIRQRRDRRFRRRAEPSVRGADERHGCPGLPLARECRPTIGDAQWIRHGGVHPVFHGDFDAGRLSDLF